MRPLILMPTINSRNSNACYLQLLSVQRCQPAADTPLPGVGRRLLSRLDGVLRRGQQLGGCELDGRRGGAAARSRWCDVRPLVALHAASGGDSPRLRRCVFCAFSKGVGGIRPAGPALMCLLCSLTPLAQAQ